MKNLIPIIILVFFTACKNDYVCECTVYDSYGNPKYTDSSNFKRTEKNAEKECEDKPNNFSSNMGSYMDCILKEQ